MRIRFLVLFVLASAVAFFAMSSSQANATTTITPDMIARIKARCVENQAALNRLHQTDAFLRNDRGNLYREISDKLMVPFNRRVASNQLDGGSLVTIAADYSSQYNKFYSTYIDYDNALSKVLDIDCSREPVAFYNALLDAREKRHELSKINTNIKELVLQYGKSFGEFKAKYDKERS